MEYLRLIDLRRYNNTHAEWSGEQGEKRTGDGGGQRGGLLDREILFRLFRRLIWQICGISIQIPF